MRYRTFFSGILFLIICAIAGLYFVGTTGFVRAQDQADEVEDAASAPIGTAFTYQGRLTDSDNPANGTYDFVFELYDDEEIGEDVQIGNTVEREAVEVVDGYFTVKLDFDSPLDGNATYLEIGVKPTDSTGEHTKLLPRRMISATPLSLYAESAGTSQRANSLGPGTLNDHRTVAVGGSYVEIKGEKCCAGLSLKSGDTDSEALLETSRKITIFGTWSETPLRLVTNQEYALEIDAEGNTHIGNLTKSGGAFKIDHPLDPTNRYLYHSFVESPDMMNIYNGNITLDESGEGWVAMPEWFEALNQEFRYQLTPIGAPGPNLYIAEQITGNRFKIAGGEAGAMVSWQVTGIRHDPYAESNRILVEEDKPESEMGTYLHPEAYGAPPERGLYFQDPESSLDE